MRTSYGHVTRRVWLILIRISFAVLSLMGLGSSQFIRGKQILSP